MDTLIVWSYQFPRLDRSSYMKTIVNDIIKISDKQIRVFVSKIDMDRYNLNFFDFIYKKRRAFDFIVETLEQSFYDCGFHRISDNMHYGIATRIKDNTGITIDITLKPNIDIPVDTIITMADWESICEITWDELTK